MRFGLVGTGPWAQQVHGPALAGTEGISLVGVWGRTPDKVAALATALGVRGYDDLDALLEQVDAVAFAVPPDVQAELALRAARAGKHLLLDKPVATTVTAAEALAQEATSRDVASVVFFTDRFSDGGATWLEEAARVGRWRGGAVRWLAALDAPGNPHAQSSWRRERGALWDIGPHALACLVGALGPVAAVVAVAGEQDLVHLVLTHDSGASSTVTLSLFAPAAATSREVWLWGENGTAVMPTRSDSAVTALGRAATAVRAGAASGEPHAADLGLGVHVVRVLAEAERQLR
jgi:predicted dehydrogenase